MAESRVTEMCRAAGDLQRTCVDPSIPKHSSHDHETYHSCPKGHGSMHEAVKAMRLTAVSQEHAHSPCLAVGSIADDVRCRPEMCSQFPADGQIGSHRILTKIWVQLSDIDIKIAGGGPLPAR